MKHIKEIESEIEKGQRQRYRDRNEIESAKAKRLGKHANTWFLDGITVNTLKVMATPNSGLKNAVQKSLNNMGSWADGGKTKVIEMGGNSITRGLNKPQDFSGPGSCHMAGRGQPCNTDPEHDCRSARIVYKSTCQHCGARGQETQYIGTSGRSLHSRTLEHMAEVRNRSSRNAQAKHHWSVHPDEEPNFKTQIIKGGIFFNVERQIQESIDIDEARQNIDVNLLNQRSEWGQRGLVRLVVEQ